MLTTRRAMVEWLLGLSRLPCAVHYYHRPAIKRSDGRYTVESHHILPLEFGGRDTFTHENQTVTNRVSVCPTGHTAIHELLRVWMKLDGEPPWEIRRCYATKERDLAEEGYRRWVLRGRPELASIDIST